MSDEIKKELVITEVFEEGWLLNYGEYNSDTDVKVSREIALEILRLKKAVTKQAIQSLIEKWEIKDDYSSLKGCCICERANLIDDLKQLLNKGE